MSIFFILLTSQTFCLLLAILGVMFARHGLKQKPLSWYGKAPNFAGLILNLLVVAFVLINIPGLFQYWQYTKGPVMTLDALSAEPFMESQNISTNPPPD